MFANACTHVRECVYGLIGFSQVGPAQLNAGNATGFMVAPGFLATAAHFVHVDNDRAKPVHSVFEAIRAPDIGQQMERATLVAEDPTRDIAILQLATPRSNSSVTLEPNTIAPGTSCGFLGFPLAQVLFSQSGQQLVRNFNLVERFQSASVSAYGPRIQVASGPVNLYETDGLMYGGSSGCPAFLSDGRVFAMQMATV